MSTVKLRKAIVAAIWDSPLTWVEIESAISDDVERLADAILYVTTRPPTDRRSVRHPNPPPVGPPAVSDPSYEVRG